MSSYSSLPFSLLPYGTSSNRGELVEVDLLSKVEETPKWVRKHAKDADVMHVMEKQLFASDVSDQQCRFMIPEQVVQETIEPEMRSTEIEEANLNRSEPLFGSGRQTEGRKRGREHKGHEVMVYDRSESGCLLYLTRWDSAKSSVLKGANYNQFIRRNQFAAGDLVDMWVFRGSDNKLSFVIGKKGSDN